MRRLLAAFLPALLLSACATHFENQRLADNRLNVERRTVDVSRPERPLILLAISGGGSRAAALGWAVLRELRQYKYTGSDGLVHPLTDDIAVVSSVSGGSVIGAYFALNGAIGLDRFGADFLTKDNTRSLVLQAINPVNWLSLGLKGESRSTLLEELLDDQLFHHATFADLDRPGKPYLILNATDMAGGEVFAFTPKRFDDICSDLDAQAITTGVVASAAVPVLFAPIALRNHSAQPCVGNAVPPWITVNLKGRSARYDNVDTFKLARYAYDLRHGGPTPPAPSPGSVGVYRQIDYVYLVDGGLADNLGIHGLIEVLSSPNAARIVVPPEANAARPQTIIEAINNGRVQTVVALVINARSEAPSGIRTSDSRPGILGMVKGVTSVPIDASTSSVSSQMQDLIAELDAAGDDATKVCTDPKFKRLKSFGISIDFDQLDANDPVQRTLRDQAKDIPTLWSVTAPELDVIDRAGSTLLRQHPCFQRLLLSLDITPSFPIDTAFANTACRLASDPR